LATAPHSKESKLVYLETTHRPPVSEPFEYPHFYTPTRLAQEAARALQSRLDSDLPELVDQPNGRMLGVLVVEQEAGRLADLSAYSGEVQQHLAVLPFVTWV